MSISLNGLWRLYLGLKAISSIIKWWKVCTDFLGHGFPPFISPHFYKETSRQKPSRRVRLEIRQDVAWRLEEETCGGI